MSIPKLPLDQAEHHMLQVLLPSFTLEKLENPGGRRPAGVYLTAEFSDATDAMWRRQQRDLVQNAIDDFAGRAARIDKDLADFLANANAATWTFREPPFVFRYGNGGTLPILKIGEREYYCLPYRDIPPIGWNLANGASDSRHELLNPLITIERELREELIIVDADKRIRYALQWEDEDALDRPEFILAREFWRRRRKLDIGKFAVRKSPVTWIAGPDAVSVKCAGQVTPPTTDVFLNISAADFGIEVDRIARIHVEEGASVLDGETYGSKLVDRPIGLFDVDGLADAFLNGATAFMPDILFLSGDRLDRRDEIEVAHGEACAAANRPLRSERENDAWENCKARFALCPVTRQLMTRHFAQEKLYKRSEVVRRPDKQHFDVFISSTGHEHDQAIARKIHDHLAHDPEVGPVYFYKETPKGMDWMREVEAALKSAATLIVVCTDIARVNKIDYEWKSFFIWLKNKVKKVGQVVPVLHGMQYFELPMPLCTQDPVVWDPDPVAPLNALSWKVKFGVDSATA